MRAYPARRALTLFTNPILAGLVSVACLTAGAPRTASAQAGGPLPYAPIANPLPDTMDQLYRDSINIKFSKVRVNQAGYRTGDRKFFYVVGGTGSAFQVINEARATVASGTLTPTGFSTSGQLSIKASNNAALVSGGDTRYTMIGPVYSGAVSEGEIPSTVPTGKYRIVAGTDTSATFTVDNRIYSWVKDALLKFYGIQRDGNTDSWFHPPSHMKDGPNGDGSLTGGWFDCGDHLKESQTMGYAMAMLSLYAAALPDRDADHYGRNQNDTYRTDGVPDMLYEAKIGTDYFLKSFDLAKGDPSQMITSIGSFGGDHGWWGRPEFQDGLPHDRGGPVRDVRVEVGANVTGKIAAGLAFFSRQYSAFDKAYADRCLAASKKIYAYGKTHLTITNSSAYNGDASYRDDLALAAVALLWASKDTTYKNDLIANATLGTYGNTNYYTQGTFAAGWLADSGQGYLNRGGANTCWASLQMPTLWAFYRLILKDSAQAATYGITSQRLDLIEDVAFGYIANLGWMQGGASTIALPVSNPQLYGGNILTYDPLWKINTHTGASATPVYNRYIAGNSSDIFGYYDMAKDLQGKALPHTPASMDWKADEVHQLLVRQMDYMLGVNPWDISMIYGVGSKNFNHPHHRGANPEGSNLPGAFYHYRPPVGALQGGYPVAGQNGSGLYYEFWGDYDHSEACLDGTTSILLPALGLSNDEAPDSLTLQVQIEYVSTDHAIILVRQSRFGTASIRYGTSATALNTVKTGDSAGMEHRIVLTGLTPGTTYYFQAEASDVKGLTGINDNGGNKFIFTTLAQPPGAAQIAQVKVCNVTDKTAEILWYTPNGAYDSKVVYGTGKPPTQVHDGDVTGHPTKFHYVILDSLKEKTQYWFYVESNGVRDDNQGQFYTFTTKIQHVEFDVRAVSYDLQGKKYLAFNIINQDIKSYDSLDVRLYMRATEAQMADFGVRADIGFSYLSTGFIDPDTSQTFKTKMDALIQKERPVRMDETFDAATNTYIWYFSLPMGNATMRSGARFRVDVAFVKRNENGDLLDESSTFVPSSKDWSWASHSRAQGDPVDFGGVKVGTKDSVDAKYIFTEVDPYITVYRKGQFVWGYSPSSKEQATKVANYKMDVQITSPLNNPPEDYKKLDQASSTAIVKGKVTITDAGKLTDVWVNGERVANVSQVATYDANANAWNLNVPIKLKAGPNEVDLTLFGGADPSCQGCVGCAFVNRHFYLEFNKANAFPSTLTLLTPDGQPVPPLAVIGQTKFIVEVQDKNGDLTANPDQLQVMVANPNQGDSLQVTLTETGPKTGVFRSTVPVAVLDLPPAATGAGQIAMTEGDSVWVTYLDPTDPDDSSHAYLYTPATFPQAVSGWYLDTDGDGAVDKAVVNYSKPLKSVPDSLQLWFPNAAAQRTYASAAGGFTFQGTRVEVALNPPFAAGTTGFAGDNHNSGRSFLTDGGKSRTSAFTVADSAGPVLTKAVLAPASSPELPDTLTVTFSETIKYTLAEKHPFLAWQGGAAHPASDITVLASPGVQPTRLTLLLAPDSKIILAPGDSLRIAAGIADLLGNRPSANNRWVAMEGNKRQPPVPPPVFTVQWEPRVYDAQASGPDGAPFVLSSRDAGGNWLPVQGSLGSLSRNCAGTDCGQPLPSATDGSVSKPSILITFDKPFRYESVLFSNLGVFVAGISGTVDANLMDGNGNASAPVHLDAATGHYQMRLIWNGMAVNGIRAGTGAYVWKVSVVPLGAGKQGALSSSKIIGLLRRN